MLCRNILLKLGLTQPQIDLIIGTLLGDGNLQTYTNGLTWRYRALHAREHEEYLNHKYDVLRNLISQPEPTPGDVYDERTGQTYFRNYFNTTVHPAFKVIADAFYKFDSNSNKWVKVIPSNIIEFLTPNALAYFHQDDGCLKWKGHSNAMRICTENFTLQEVQLLQACIYQLYNIQTSLNKKTLSDGTVGYRIYIPEGSSTAYRKVIEPYLIKCMCYKVSNGSYGTL